MNALGCSDMDPYGIEMFGVQGRLLLEWQQAAGGIDPESS